MDWLGRITEFTQRIREPLLFWLGISGVMYEVVLDDLAHPDLLWISAAALGLTGYLSGKKNDDESGPPK